MSIINKLWQCKINKYPFRLALMCDIKDFSLIPISTIFPHPLGIVIRDCIKLGNNCTIMQNVSIGRKDFEDNSIMTVGNGVFFGANSLIIGNGLNIGNNAKIGAGALVLKDVPEGATVTGVWK